MNIPPIEEQERIGNMLFILDSKLSYLNNKIKLLNQLEKQFLNIGL